MESGIHYQPQTIQTLGDVFWSYQLTGDVPDNDKLIVMRSDKHGKGSSLYRQHHHFHK